MHDMPFLRILMITFLVMGRDHHQDSEGHDGLPGVSPSGRQGRHALGDPGAQPTEVRRWPFGLVQFEIVVSDRCQFGLQLLLQSLKLIGVLRAVREVGVLFWVLLQVEKFSAT